MNAPTLIRHGLAVAAMLAAATPVLAAGKGYMSDAQQRYQRERAYCMSGQSPQGRATCLREAGAALAEARRNRLGNAGNNDYAANATARCAAQKSPWERDACIQRMRSGNVYGSVHGGGVLREIETPWQSQPAQ